MKRGTGHSRSSVAKKERRRGGKLVFSRLIDVVVREEKKGLFLSPSS